MPAHKMRTVNGTMEPFSMFLQLNLAGMAPHMVSPVGNGRRRVKRLIGLLAAVAC